MAGALLPFASYDAARYATAAVRRLAMHLVYAECEVCRAVPPCSAAITAGGGWVRHQF